MDQLLLKQKHNLLTYLLVEQNGKIFDGLLKHLQHHSLAMFLIKLLEVQIQPESKKVSWDGSDSGENENEEAEPELTVEQKHMAQILKDKTTMVVNHLIDALSEKNQDDIHMTLNAFYLLQEFCDNETLYQLLIEEKTFARIVAVCGQLDTNRQNLPHALYTLIYILAQFGEQDAHFFKDNDKNKAFEQVKPHISDICYTCLIVLRANSDDELVENQAGVQIKKLGIHRIRAIELLRLLMLVLKKTVGLKESGLISEVLRRKIIETYIYLIKNYEFCSISHQQGLIILNYLKELFDETDLMTLKKFVRSTFEGDTKFHFPSGKVASGMAMGQVTKIAFELKNLTQQQLDNMDSDDDEEEMSE